MGNGGRGGVFPTRVCNISFGYFREEGAGGGRALGAHFFYRVLFARYSVFACGPTGTWSAPGRYHIVSYNIMYI